VERLSAGLAAGVAVQGDGVVHVPHVAGVHVLDLANLVAYL